MKRLAEWTSSTWRIRLSGTLPHIRRPLDIVYIECGVLDCALLGISIGPDNISLDILGLTLYLRRRWHNKCQQQ